MSNPHGSPIWYELVTPDPDGAKRFYDAAVEWTVEPRPAGPMDYRMISAPSGQVGGVMRLTEEMRAGGATPGWLVYFGVEDVDASAAKAGELGAHILVPPNDIPDVGRFSLLADTQGAPFYIMRPSSVGTSTVFAPGVRGRCSWNELWTHDMQAALAFYGALFGFQNRETMEMGPRGGYHFLDHGDMRLGAAAEMKDRPARWNVYFNVADVDAAVDRVRTAGGAIDMGPYDTPSGDRIVIGTDPQGAIFSLVGRA